MNYRTLIIILILGCFQGALAQDSVVVISEIHYNPEEAVDTLEFVEIHNLFAVDVDLSNWSLTGAIEYHFPAGTKISGGGYLVVARDPAALQAATGYGPALGPWSGALNNSGEKVFLMMDSIGPRIMDAVEYGDGGKWPTAADGSGASLEKLRNNLPGENATSWSWSQSRNGTPGSGRAATTLPAVVINETAAAASGSFFIELYNRGTTAVNLNGYVLSSSDATRADKVLSSGTLAAGGFVSMDAASLGYIPADGERIFLYTAAKSLVVDAVKIGNFPKARYPDGDRSFSRPHVTTPAAANIVIVNEGIVINEILYNGYPDPGVESIAPIYSSIQIVNYPDVWRYENTGASLSANWANAVHNAWPGGAGLIGYEPDTANLLPQTIQTPLYNPGQMTYYFEREFTFNGETSDAQIRITHKIDDGAVFYLNGVEIGRYNMPTGAITSATPAKIPIELNETVQTLSASSLVAGSNRLSVQVHQGGSNSSDLVFGLQAELVVETTPGVPAISFSESPEEWIELYNKGNATVNLGGWKLNDAVDHTFGANTNIEPGGYLVVAKDPGAFSAKYPTIPVAGPWSGKLSNSDEAIRLEDHHGNLVDEVHYYDEGRWSKHADGGGSSLELKDPGSDNSQPESWGGSETKGDWNTYTYRAVATDNGFGLRNFHELLIGMLDKGEMLLDDISVIEDPDGAATEFIANGDFSGDAVGGAPSGWRLAGNHGLHGKTMVVDDGGNKVLKLVATSATREFHNQLQTTFANNQQVVVGQTYVISYRAKWLKGDNQLNTRLYFDYLSNTQRITTDPRWGTPGRVNSQAVSNAGPVFSELRHSPTIPAAGQAATVEVRLVDPDGISQVQLNYRANHLTTFSTAAMTHQGGGLYRGTIPAFSSSNMVQFYVQAVDNHASVPATSYFPAAAENSRAMIQWQDRQSNTSVLHNLRLIMRPQDRQILHTGIHTMSNHRFPATLVVDESEVYYNVGVRLKASAAGRNNYPSYNIGFDAMQLFNGVHDSIVIDIGFLERQMMAKHLMSNGGKGLASQYDDPVRLVFPSDSLGNVSKTGLALLSAARYSSAWHNSQFENGGDGTLYNMEMLYSPLGTSGAWKESFPYSHTNGEYEFKDLPLGKETYRWGFQIRSNRRSDNYEPLINTAKAMGLGGAASVAEVEKYIDVNQWARTWAWLSLTGNDDLYTRDWAHNFRMYSRPSDHRLVALPTDPDASFTLATSASLIGGDNLGDYLRQPSVKRLFYQHIQNLCQTVLSSSYVDPWAAHFASLTGLDFSPYQSYLVSRCNYAASQLPEQVHFAITSNGGSGFSVASSSTVLEGTGWLDVAAIHVDGHATPVNWLDDERWQVTVPLAVGSNLKELTAFNLEGVQVGFDTISITNTSTTDLASAANLVLTEMMYHPIAPDASEVNAGFANEDDFEFLELQNTGTNRIDLSACRFTDGITYTFPAGTTLLPGQRLVLARHLGAFDRRYGSEGKQITGPYTGKLSNSGETVTLASAGSATIFSVTYEDGGDWSGDADGDGYSLVNLNPVPGTNLNLPGNWSPSRQINGGPGVADLWSYDHWLGKYPALAAAGKAGESDDLDGDGFSHLLEYAFGSDPTDPASQPLLPLGTEMIDFGSGAAPYLLYSHTRPIAAPGLIYTAQTSSTLNNDWNDNPSTVGAVYHRRTRNGDTETITYRSRLPIGNDATRMFLRWRVDKL